MGHYKIPSLDLRDRGFFSFLADKLNLSPTSEGNSQRGAGGNNPQFQGKINADTGANINFGNQVYYGGLNDQEALRTFKSRRINVLVKEISERIRRWNDSLLEKINAGFLRLQLYKKGLDTFKDDPSASDLLHEHLLATTATSILDTLLLHLVVGNKLKNLAVEVSQTVEPTSLTSADRVSLAKSLPGSLSAKAVEALEGKVFYDLQLYEEALDLLEEVLSTFDVFKKLENGISVEESQTVEPTSPTSADRVSLAKSLPGSLSAKAVAAVEALEGKCVDTFITALQAVAEESGLLLKKLDKKLERTLLHSYCKDLTSQVSSEVDPVPLLPKVVSLLFLKNKLGDSALKVLVDYHAATVVLSDLQSAATEVEEDCTSERFLSERKFLAGLMPELKALVLNNDQACMQNKEFDGDDYHTPSLYSSSDGL